ncbi:hypothetical protein ACJ5NV_07770 [Loktanella agnita]|uniref:hypothetical protein n=1 Tax=Loktanella agnita TaxID=287097 RepID=UPI003985DAAF
MTAEMAVQSGGMDWSHLDPFDRMVAATAIELACPLISRNRAFDGLESFSGWKGRFWSRETRGKSSSATSNE